MKFVHIADMHFDSPLTNLTDKGNKFIYSMRKRNFNLLEEHKLDNFIEFQDFLISNPDND